MDKEQHRIEDIVPRHWVEETIVANGIRQHYYRTGGDKPALVLLHGFSENGLCWWRVARALEDDYDVIMVDARGHGLSDGPEHGYGQAILNQDVAAFIQALNLLHPALFGFSNGALTAGQVAANYPELLRAVVVEDPPWGESSRQPPVTTQEGEPWPGYTEWLNAWLAWHRALRTQTFEERVSVSQHFLPPGALDWPTEELMTHLEAQAQFNLDVLNHVSSMPARSPWRETVERIDCPILLLLSDAGRDAGVSQQQVAATWKNGQFVSFENTSHFMHHEMQGERFDQYIGVIKAFLSGVETIDR